MLDRHHAAHAGLACIYVVLFLILIKEGAFPHATCALAAGLIYFLLVLGT